MKFNSKMTNDLKKKKKNKKKQKKSIFGGDDDDDDNKKKNSGSGSGSNGGDKKLLFDFDNDDDDIAGANTNIGAAAATTANNDNDDTNERSKGSSKKRRRWDVSTDDNDNTNSNANDNNNAKKQKNNNNLHTNTTSNGNVDVEDNGEDDDDLDKFMNQLQAGTMGTVAVQNEVLNINLAHGNTNTNAAKGTATSTTMTTSGGVITPEALAQLNGNNHLKNGKGAKTSSTSTAAATTSSSPSDGNENENENDIDDEEEEKARRSFLAALRQTTINNESTKLQQQQPQQPIVAQLASEVQSEKQRREAHLQSLKKQAAEAQKALTQSSQPDIGRIYYSDVESGVMEEAERNLDVMVASSSVDALEILAELNKKKELKAVDHSLVDYLPVRKNLYIVPRSVAKLTEEEVMERRARHKIRIRGRGAPSPVETFEECALSERILSILRKMKIERPFAVQAQCLPCIMAGRDVIGIAKTGSGKTLAYLLPMLRHIGDQPDLAPHESGPIGLILAPARELAVQIHSVTKSFAKQLGIRSTAVYGGAGVKEQIADLKRGTHIAVGTPGRMIDILTMQAGKILSLQRVSYVVLDEADRMFDMGFAPQISAILAAVRPDRQTVLFSATFPKTVEALARKSLKYPIEVLVGGRSVASDSVKQHGEVIEEEDKFLRLLQLLGEHAEDGKKVIIFVDTQVRADSLFEQLIRCGYPSLSLHGGKEQEDRDSTLSDFKRVDGPNVLVATSVAGRGLDVATCGCVINYSAPNHLEDYVHRVGRTGRAGNSGFSFTFVNSGDESKYAPIVVRAMIEAGQAKNISDELRKLSDEFKSKVERGEARYAGSGFKGKGYSYDSSELNDAQKLARLEKRQALIEAGMIDPDEEDRTPVVDGEDNEDKGTKTKTTAPPADVETSSPSKKTNPGFANMSADLLSLPGMRDLMMKKAGIEVPSQGNSSSSNHFVEEIDINDYPREARWKVTQKETTSRLQDEFQAAVTLKGKHIAPNTEPQEGERRLYLHVEATTDRILKTCVQEIHRLLNEETLRVGTKGLGGSHKYNVLG
mmetsp:Transcript_13361/g.20256  ORF Transcript_13361/g.20256 Transcript_13361/m.20256 type:complete len:1047 (-) Transcript_13361:56-3196(-)